ncbi:hypothetical protein ASE61_06965 [Bosea sp. Root670]|nr:hypothetical protein ASE61_06965 [Bosea sp. Root670]
MLGTRAFRIIEGPEFSGEPEIKQKCRNFSMMAFLLRTKHVDIHGETFCFQPCRRDETMICLKQISRLKMGIDYC